jgi:menaquinol-cytochrome c reductase iron-sulfur subunit
MNTKLLHTTDEVRSYQVGTGFNELMDPPQPEGVRAEYEVPSPRRSFLGLMSALIGASISGLVGITLGRFSIVPALSISSSSEWVDVAPLEELGESKPTIHSVMVSQNAGWGRFTSEQSVWVVKKGEQLKVFSSVCPHLGCTINENATGFGCVCHNSAWDGEGEKLRGPAPRSMDTLEHKLESNVLKVRYQNFKQGVPEKQTAS